MAETEALGIKTIKFTRRIICSGKDKQFLVLFADREKRFFGTIFTFEEKNEYDQKSRTEKYEQLDMPSIGECPVCMEKQYMYDDIKLCDGKLAVQHGICKDCYHSLPQNDTRCPICRAPSQWDSAALMYATDIDFRNNILKTITLGTLQESFFHCSI